MIVDVLYLTEILPVMYVCMYVGMYGSVLEEQHQEVTSTYTYIRPLVIEFIDQMSCTALLTKYDNTACYFYQ
jgi:hypothetical protein